LDNLPLNRERLIAFRKARVEEGTKGIDVRNRWLIPNVLKTHHFCRGNPLTPIGTSRRKSALKKLSNPDQVKITRAFEAS
jgi:hypothetical protein